MNGVRDAAQVLPKGWANAKIGEICSLVNGRAFKADDWSSTGLPIIRIQNLNDHNAEFNYCSFDVEEKFYVDDGQLLFAWSGTPGTSFGAHIWNRGKGILNQHIFKVNINEQYLNKKFLMNIINYNVDMYIKKAHGTAGLAHITKGKFEESLILLPPLPEQHRIVARIEELFSHLDAGVLALKKAKAQLQRYRQAVLKAAVEGRLTEGWRKAHPEVEPAEKLLEQIIKAHQRPPERIESTQLPNLPWSWIWASTDQLASNEKYSMAIGPFGSNLKVVDYRTEGVPLIFVRNIRLGLFNGHGTWFVSNEKAEELRAHFVESGDILITKMGDPPGDACIYPEGMPPAIITADCIKWRLSPLLKEKAYFSNAINSIVVKKQIIQFTKGVAQQKISLIRFKKIGIPLPPLQEQNEIAKCIESRFSFFDQTKSEFDRAILLSASLRQSILKRAFEGKLVPQDPSDEPASVLLEQIEAERAKSESNHRRLSRRRDKPIQR